MNLHQSCGDNLIDNPLSITYSHFMTAFDDMGYFLTEEPAHAHWNRRLGDYFITLISFNETILALRYAENKRISTSVYLGYYNSDTITFTKKLLSIRSNCRSIASKFMKVISMLDREIATQTERIKRLSQTSLVDGEVLDLIVQIYDLRLIEAAKVMTAFDRYRSSTESSNANVLLAVLSAILKPRQHGYDLFYLPSRSIGVFEVIELYAGRAKG